MLGVFFWSKVKKRVNFKKFFEELVLMEYRSRFQKMKVKWVKEGDFVFNFFLRWLMVRRSIIILKRFCVWGGGG